MSGRARCTGWRATERLAFRSPKAPAMLLRGPDRPGLRRGGSRQSGGWAGADGRGGEPAGDQPDGERQLEQSTGDGADEPCARDAGQLQQVAPGEARVADEAPDS